MKTSVSVLTIILVAIAALLCCVCLGGIIAFSFVMIASENSDFNFNFESTPFIFEEGNVDGTATPNVVRPTPQPTPITRATEDIENSNGSQTTQPTPQDDPTEVIPQVDLEETLRILEEAEVPENNVRELAMRLGGKDEIPETVDAPAGELSVGAQDTFWVTNVDTNENFEVDATLRYVTPHLYFWIENGVRYDQNDLRDLAEAFETKIYPTNREFSVSEVVGALG